MNSITRNKRKLRESPCLRGGAIPGTDQQQNLVAQAARRTPALQLAVPQLEQYYPGTSIPMDGWFHACKMCRCWTAFSASAVSGEAVPLCRRCAPHEFSTSMWDTNAVQQQQQQQTINKSATNSTSRRSDDAAVRPPVPGTASLQELCQSPAVFNDPAGFISPGAVVGATATSSKTEQTPAAAAAAAAAGGGGVRPGHNCSHSSISSPHRVMQQQLLNASSDPAAAAMAELLLGRCREILPASTQQQQGDTNISRHCTAASPSYGLSSLSFQQLLDAYTPLLQVLPMQQQQQQQYNGLHFLHADNAGAAAALDPNQLIADAYAAAQQHLYPTLLASAQSTDSKQGSAGNIAAATCGDQHSGQNALGAIALLLSQWYTTGPDPGFPQQQQLQQQQQQPTCTWH